MCKYCCVDSKILNDKPQKILGESYSVGAYIAEHNDTFNVELGNTLIFSKKVKYCPMCGQKLDERNFDLQE